ncbi:spore germination protein [Neobacillus mesonae]|nr:spore germination protein [Neobacillus mesonae]
MLNQQLNSIADPEFLKKRYEGSADVAVQVCNISEDNRSLIILIYTIGLCDSERIYRNVLPKLDQYYKKFNSFELSDERLAASFPVTSLQKEPSLDELDDIIFKGDLLLIFPFDKLFLQIALANTPKRSPIDSNTEISVIGPRDCFIEDMVTNIALIRKRMRTQSLRVESYTLGRRTKTEVALLYLEDVLNPKILKEIQTGLKKIDTDAIYSLNQIESFLTNSKFKLLPLMDYTGRPDYCVSSLLAGRFILIVDGNPMVLVAPAGISLLLKSPEDVHFNYSYVTFVRLLRGLCLFLSIFLPSIWVALMAFHQDQIPFRLLATVSLSRIGIPFSAQIEMFILLLLLEIFREAGVRLPSAIGVTLTSIGGLIIGDASIRAGLVSPSIVVIGAITAIAGVTLINQTISTVSSFLRFIFFAFSSFLGMYGVILGIVLFVAYMANLKSFGVSYLEPLSPLHFKEALRSVFRLPWANMRNRPASLHPQDPDRAGGAE